MAQRSDIEAPEDAFHGIPDSGNAKGVGLGMNAVTNTSTGDSLSNSKHSKSLQELKVFSGYSSFDVGIKKKKKSQNWDERKKTLVTIMLMSIFSIIGAVLRVFIAQFFGEECKNPGTVGWLKASQPLCVTANGEATLEGGIIFADLPANLLGSFIMGMMQSTDILGYPKYCAIPWLNKDHKFQFWSDWHLAIKTGFCGSLTTYSAWNSEMVVMLFGTGATDQHSLALRALLGYVIGLETAMASFNLGKNIGSWLFSRLNPDMQVEKNSIEDKQARGIYINTALPDFERRFLSEMNMYEYEEYIDPTVIQFLFKWRESTVNIRKVGDPLLPLLTDVEHEKIVLKKELDVETRLSAENAGWDIKALDCWVNEMRVCAIGKPKISDYSGNIFLILFTFIMLNCVLISGLIFVDGNDAYSVTWRTMWYAALIAPLGALLRWQWSSFNGRLSGDYSWFPLGTFMANVLGCIVSIVMIGLEFRFEKVGDLSSFWLPGTLRAIKIGFSGCLTTVSTFVSEISSFLSGPTPLQGYIYASVSLGTTFFLSIIAYAICVMGLLDMEDN